MATISVAAVLRGHHGGHGHHWFKQGVLAEALPTISLSVWTDETKIAEQEFTLEFIINYKESGKSYNL